MSLRPFELIFNFFHLLLDSLLPPAANEGNEANARRNTVCQRQAHKNSELTSSQQWNRAWLGGVTLSVRYVRTKTPTRYVVSMESGLAWGVPLCVSGLRRLHIYAHISILRKTQRSLKSFKTHLNLSIFWSRLTARNSPSVPPSPALTIDCHACWSASSKSSSRSHVSRYLNSKASACSNTLSRV